MKISQLMVEVTRKCNMTCEHCMRGPAQNISMSKEIMINFLSDIKHINLVGFTGGEPTLPDGIKAIKQFIKICKTFKITVDSFFIITNAKVWKKDIPKTVSSLLKFCKKNSQSIVEISRDQFHDDINNQRMTFFDNIVKQFKKEIEDVKFKVWNRSRHIDDICNQGNAASSGIGTFDYSGPSISPWSRGGIIRGIFYLNCVGNVVWGADWSYEEQNQPKHIVCSANDKFNERKFNEFYANYGGQDGNLQSDNRNNQTL